MQEREFSAKGKHVPIHPVLRGGEPRGAGESSILQMFRTCLDKALDNLTYLWSQPCCEQGLGLETSRGPFHLHLPVGLLFYITALPNYLLHIPPTTPICVLLSELSAMNTLSIVMNNTASKYFTSCSCFLMQKENNTKSYCV